jgi:hypothetical protein
MKYICHLYIHQLYMYVVDSAPLFGVHKRYVCTLIFSVWEEKDKDVNLKKSVDYSGVSIKNKLRALMYSYVRVFSTKNINIESTLYVYKVYSLNNLNDSAAWTSVRTCLPLQ